MDREAVKKAHTTLHSETKTGVKLKGPKREFVLLEHWDPKLDGELDEAHIVEETWQGKKVKGIWKAKGRAGVLEASQYEDTSLAERTEEHSGSGPFAQQALVTKKLRCRRCLRMPTKRGKSTQWPQALHHRQAMFWQLCRKCCQT